MLKKTEDLEEKTQLYIEELNDFCKQYDLLGKVKVDHIGLKCSSKELYEQQRAMFEFSSLFLYQSIISNRRIAVIGLTTCLATTVGPLRYLELSDQKPDGSQKDSFDHIEIVPTSISYDQLVNHLTKKGVNLKEVIKPHHSTFDVVLSSGFVIKLSRGILLDKIKREEMV